MFILRYFQTAINGEETELTLENDVKNDSSDSEVISLGNNKVGFRKLQPILEHMYQKECLSLD